MKSVLEHLETASGAGLVLQNLCPSQREDYLVQELQARLDNRKKTVVSTFPCP